MSWSSTIAAILAAVDGVAGVENVYERPLAGEDVSLATQEAKRSAIVGGTIQAWELEAAPRAVERGCDGYQETELDAQITASWVHTAASLTAFRDKLRLVAEALVAALPQMKQPESGGGGVETSIEPEPVRLPTGQSAWRATVRFSLWETSTT